MAREVEGLSGDGEKRSRWILQSTYSGRQPRKLSTASWCLGVGNHRNPEEGYKSQSPLSFSHASSTTNHSLTHSLTLSTACCSPALTLPSDRPSDRPFRPYAHPLHLSQTQKWQAGAVHLAQGESVAAAWPDLLSGGQNPEVRCGIRERLGTPLA